MRRDPFSQLRAETGVEPIDLIPVARPRKRKREWERAHRGRTFRVPAPLVDRAKAVREKVLALAQKHLTTADQVADVLLAWAVREVQAGRVTIETRPTMHRKMAVRLVEAGGGWPEAIEEPKVKKRARDLRITYRLSSATLKAIEEAARDNIAAGELVVTLLEYALTALREGRVRLSTEPEIVRQKVSAW